MIKAINEALCNGTSFSGRIHCYKIGARKPTWCEINIGPVHKATDGALVCFALFVRDVDVLKKGAGSMDMVRHCKHPSVSVPVDLPLLPSSHLALACH